jgi:Lar family restriction alleviation protein
MTNEEKFKTPEKRLAAFMEYCDRHRAKFNGCTIGNCPLRTTSTRACQFFWLALEAEDEKPIDCPFCGGDNIDTFETDFGRDEEPCQSAVKCLSCGALVFAEDRGEAIAKWNRRAK